MGQDNSKGNVKSKRFDDISPKKTYHPSSECSEKGHHPGGNTDKEQGRHREGNKYEEPGRQPGGNKKKRQGRQPGGNKKKSQARNGEGNKYEEQGRHPGGSTNKEHGRQLGGQKYEEQKDSAAYQGEISHDLPQQDQDQKIKTYEEELKRKTEKIKHLEAEKSDLINRGGNQNSKIRTYEEKLKRNTEKIKQLEAEKNDLLNRLSSEAAIKMTYNNPNITNWSDQDRPTKVSERYAELYGNQWTDAFGILQTKHNMSDTKAVEVLLDILYVSFRKCKEVRQQRENLENCITKYLCAAEGDLTVLEVMKTLKDERKKNLVKIRQDYTKTVQEALQERYQKEVQSISHYLYECVEICLLMNLHNPALELRGCMLEKTPPFDVTLFRPFTESGGRIAYMVWPALQLSKDGPLLWRGIAQGTSDAAKVHKDHPIKENHAVEVSGRQEESKLEQTMYPDQTSNNWYENSDEEFNETSNNSYENSDKDYSERYETSSNA